MPATSLPLEHPCVFGSAAPPFVEIAKQTATMNVLGVYVPRPIVRTPRGANYEAYEYAIGLLPEEKRLAVQSIVEEEIIGDGMNHDRPLPHLEAVETYRVLAAERQAGLNQVLTPAEFELYERNTTPCGTELARQVIGMEVYKHHTRSTPAA